MAASKKTILVKMNNQKKNIKIIKYKPAQKSQKRKITYIKV